MGFFGENIPPQVQAYDYEIKMYLKCMRRIKNRLYIIKERLALGIDEKTKEFDIEVIALQFRSILELILLSSLAANQDEYTKGFEKLKDEWSRFSIIKFFDSKNLDYYPKPVNVIATRESPTKVHVNSTNKETGFLTKDEFDEIFLKCNSYIHPANPFADERDYTIWDLFPVWFDKITGLLETHIISMFEQDRALFVYINFEKYPVVDNEDMQMIYLLPKQKIVYKDMGPQ